MIIEAAAEIADRSGLEDITLTLVAEHLGVRKPSLYNHINGLPELRRGLAIWGTEQLKNSMGAAAIGKAKKDAVMAIAVAYREFAHRRPGLYRAIVATPDRGDPAMGKATKSLMAVIAAVIEPYNFSGHDTRHAVRGLRSIMHGFVALEAAGWFAAPVDRDESYTQLIKTFIRGIESLDCA